MTEWSFAGDIPQPPTYHDDRLRNAPVGHFFDVMTNGWGKMNGYASQIPVADRWAIVAYIKALQASQNPNAGPATGEDAANAADASGLERKRIVMVIKNQTIRNRRIAGRCKVSE